MLEILEKAIINNDSNKQLEILEAVDEILVDNIILLSFPQLAQLLYNKLFMLIKSDEKKVRVIRFCMHPHYAAKNIHQLWHIIIQVVYK